MKPTVVIAAHNEEQVINATLDALLAQSAPGELQVIVSANGCTDRTAAVAQRSGVLVIDRPEAGKAGALNAGDQAADGYPRIYLDADIVIPPDGLATVLARLDATPRPLAVVPRRRVEITGRPWPVRAYFRINERLPAFRNGLFGRGLIALSEEGRSRFTSFPAMIADDLFLDSLFADAEKVEANEVVVTVEAPFTSRDLLRRLVRVRRGNAELRAASAVGKITVPVRPAARWAWLKDVIMNEPRLAPAAIPYVGLTIAAAMLARSKPRLDRVWGRDESTRRARSSNGGSPW